MPPHGGAASLPPSPGSVPFSKDGAPAAVARMACRASGAALRAPTSGALRPVGRGRGSTVRLPRALPLATRIRDAPHGSPSGAAPLTPPAPPRTAAFDGSASLPIIPPCRASRALAPEAPVAPKGRIRASLRSQGRNESRACKLRICPHRPLFLRSAAANELALASAREWRTARLTRSRQTRTSCVPEPTLGGRA